MITKIYKDIEEFNRRVDFHENGVTLEHSKSFIDWEEDNETNVGCFNCISCKHCKNVTEGTLLSNIEW